MNNFNKDIKLIKNTYEAYLNVIEMLRERGYTIIDDNILSLDMFSHEYDKSTPFIYIFNHEINKKEIFFSIFKEIKITKKDLTNKMKDITDENDYDNYLFLTSDKQILNYINDIKTKYNIDLQIFTIDSLQINILKHELQPKFILLNFEETKSFKDKNKWKSEELPKFLLNDPIPRYYNAQPGQIFKILRESMVGRNKTSSQGIYYRIVLE
jgi:DNA-directed RNA polymerase subunit H (RpoH/RPB5)